MYRFAMRLIRLQVDADVRGVLCAGTAARYLSWRAGVMKQKTLRQLTWLLAVLGLLLLIPIAAAGIRLQATDKRAADERAAPDAAFDESAAASELREMGIPEAAIQGIIRQVPAVNASAALDAFLRSGRDLEHHVLYPSDFAGRFVDEAGRLHVLCTPGSTEKYAEILKDFPDVQIETVSHSYNRLYQFALNQIDGDVLSAYVDSENNGVVLELAPDAYQSQSSDGSLDDELELDDGSRIPVTYKEAQPSVAAGMPD